MLGAGADPDAETGDGRTPLMAAIRLLTSADV
jgi:hypothetical protein